MIPVYGWVAFAILATGLALLLFMGGGATIAGISTSQFASVTAMAALLVYLAGGTLGGASMGTLARHGLVWVFAFAAVIGAYVLYQDFMV